MDLTININGTGAESAKNISFTLPIVLHEMATAGTDNVRIVRHENHTVVHVLELYYFPMQITIKDISDGTPAEVYRQLSNYVRLGGKVILPNYPQSTIKASFVANIEIPKFDAPYVPPPAIIIPPNINENGRDFGCFTEYAELPNSEKELANQGYDDAKAQWEMTAFKPYVTSYVVKFPATGNSVVHDQVTQARVFKYMRDEINYKKGYQAFFCQHSYRAGDLNIIQTNSPKRVREGTAVDVKTAVHIRPEDDKDKEMPELDGVKIIKYGEIDKYDKSTTAPVIVVNTYFGKRYFPVTQGGSIGTNFVAFSRPETTFPMYYFGSVFNPLPYEGNVLLSNLNTADLSVDLLQYYPQSEWDALSEPQQSTALSGFTDAQNNEATGMINLIDGQMLYNSGARMFWLATFHRNAPSAAFTENQQVVSVVDSKFKTTEALDEEGTYKFEINHNGFTAYVASKIQPVSGEENTYSLTTYHNLNIYFPDLKLVES